MKRLPKLTTHQIEAWMTITGGVSLRDGLRELLQEEAEHRRAKEVSDKSGVSASILRAFARGERDLRMEDAEDVLRAYGLRLEVRPI